MDRSEKDKDVAFLLKRPCGGFGHFTPGDVLEFLFCEDRYGGGKAGRTATETVIPANVTLHGI